jgi:hypothetical protein
VIVVDGDLEIGPQGHAGHGVTVVGGRITTAPGATIEGDVFQVGWPLPHPTWGVLLTAGILLLALRTLLVWLIVRVARMLASRPTTARALAASRRRPIRSVVVGALLAAGLSAAAILLALSVIGLVLSAAVAGVLLLATCLGVAFALDGVQDEQAHGTTVLLVLAVPVIGDALLALATVVALGAGFHYLVAERTTGTATPAPSGL